MLSPSTLERVSVSYRKGYYDGYDKKPMHKGEPSLNIEGDGVQIRPFANFDYEEGYKAGANDRKWNDKKS